MDKLKIIILFLILIGTQANSQPHIVALFTPHAHTFNGRTIPYRLFVPQNYDSSQVYPIVLALHGSGERGDDNLVHIQSSRLATSWADPVNQAENKCFVVAPQCPADGWWSGAWTSPIRPELATVADMVDSLFTVFSIDTNRFYVTGLSMGGYGTWDFIQRFPEKIAAAVPICGGGDSTLIANISHIPIWDFHGKIDNVVPVSESRDMITALENDGKTVVYTHCKYENCVGLADSTIEMYVESHHQHFYTEYVDGGHVIWDQSYDYTHLFPWVFSKYRMINNSIILTNLNNYGILSQNENITWNSLNQDGSVEIWFSPDAGMTWKVVTDSSANSGTYTWNTELVDDCAFGFLKIFIKNTEGFIYGQSVSSFFAIDNLLDGIPFVKILNDEFDKGLILEEDSLQLEVFIGDPEQNPLLATIYYSTNGGSDFEIAKTEIVSSDSVSQILTLDVYSLPNSNNAMIKINVNDGQNSFEDKTFHFQKQNARNSNFQATHISGNGDAIVNIQIVDPLQLTGNLYRISFDDSSFSQKVYNVYDVTSGQYVVQNAKELDGVTEGPFFDGIRLVIKDYDPPEVNFQQTGWQNSVTTLELNIYLPIIDFGTYILYGVPYAADYQITISDIISDTSSTAFGAQPIPMKFIVENITENKQSEVIFLDNDGNNDLSLYDEIYIIESDSIGGPLLTWAINVGGDPNPVMPQAGDQFLLKTYKPLSSEDIFEFTGQLSGFVTEKNQLNNFKLFNNYPNPFNPSTKIKFTLPKSEKVKIEVFNLLGQKIKTLLNKQMSSGSHVVEFTAKNLPSGVYLYRIQAGEYQEVRKMILLK